MAPVGEMLGVKCGHTSINGGGGGGGGGSAN